MKRKRKNIVAIFLYGILSCLLVWFLYRNGAYPGGADTMGHLYKGDILYREILRGNFYPLIDPLWYNGVELMRYWAPVPAYLLALCQALAGGNLFHGYLLFVGGMYLLGAVIWLAIGNRHGRTGLGAFIGSLWFFMPNNLYILFVEGNLPRALCMVFLPWLMDQIYQYLSQKHWKNLMGMIAGFLIIVLCQPEDAGMVFLAVLLFLVIYSIRFGGVRKCFHVFMGMALAVLLAGVWLYPYLLGKGSALSSAQILKTFFQDFVVSLNPFYRVRHGVEAAVYFGFAAAVTAFVGVFFGRNKASAFFGSAVVILICTTTSMYPILRHLPGGQYLWMLRYVSIALCMILFGLLVWKTLKRNWLILFCVLLAVDVLPSLSLICGDFSGRPVRERMDEAEEYALLVSAKELTTQRLALMDMSSLEAVGAFLVSGYGKPLAATFGYEWQNASTSTNVMMLNEAMETGRYYYLFDRCLELGNDSVIIQVSRLDHGSEDVEKVRRAAEACGYRLADENSVYQLYRLDTEGQFGTVSEYRAIGIGSAAEAVTMDYPAMEHGDSANLNDYAYETLSQYELIFLAGFEYTDKARAEKLLIRLAENGVRVVIAADGIPVDEHTGIQSFLDVTCQPLLFSNGYPLLHTIDGVLDCSLFPAGYTSWRAMYLNGLDEVWGKIEELDETLDFYGTVKNDNIVMIGLNLTYFYGLTQDEEVGQLLTHAMTISGNELPKRELVPIEVQYEPDRIIIRAASDNVNTGVAYHDIFAGNEGIAHRNNLTYVDCGETVILLHNPYLWAGVGISVSALAGSAVFLFLVQRMWSRRRVKKIEIAEVVQPSRGKEPCFDIAIPVGVKYRVRSVEWYDARGEKLERGAVFEKETYRVSVILETDEGECFDRRTEATVNGLKADKLEFLDDSSTMLVEMAYRVIDPFRFLRQPENAEGMEGEKITVKWMISKVPKVGYLQLLEGENWIICGTIPREAEREISVDIPYESMREGRYRLVYITGDGKPEYSEAFLVKWRKEKKMKIFVTGVNGQLGHDVMNELAKRGMEGIGSDIAPEYGGAQDGTAVCTMPYRQLDITDKAAVEAVLEEVKPDAVIHCAAWTAVDAAEENVELCRKVNADGPRNIAEVCKNLDVKMLQISTDYVFSGEGEKPWEPEDERAPKSVYGQTKYEGELAVQNTLEKYFIVRIAWVFGVNGKNFVKTMLNLSKNHDTIRVVNDQFGSPTYTFDLARLLVDMVQTTKYGVYHATNEGTCSWYDFACAIFREAGIEVNVIPVSTEEYGAKAGRPANSRMSKEKLSENGFERLPEWQDALKRYIEVLRQEKFL